MAPDKIQSRHYAKPDGAGDLSAPLLRVSNRLIEEVATCLRAVAAPTSRALIWRLKLNPRATLTTWLAESTALKAKNLEGDVRQKSYLDTRLVFGCGIGHSQNRIGQGRREDYGKEGKNEAWRGKLSVYIPRARAANSTSVPMNLEIDRAVLHIRLHLQNPGPGNSVQIA